VTQVIEYASAWIAHGLPAVAYRSTAPTTSTIMDAVALPTDVDVALLDMIDVLKPRPEL